MFKIMHPANVTMAPPGQLKSYFRVSDTSHYTQADPDPLEKDPPKNAMKF